MRISQRLEYAFRALAQLAKRHDGKTLTRLEDLAQREEISSNFLVQILNDLRRAGLVESRRGQAGGYLLASPPNQITLCRVVDAVEPTLLQSTISSDGESGNAVKLVWDRLSMDLRQKLEVVTLEALANDPTDTMFYI
jgi:Rrf2 family protein